jgi:hypothetical protein
MLDREIVRRAEESHRAPEQRASFTIKEWCEYRRISPAMFYKLDTQGLAPKTHNVGVKRLISGEADAAWIRAREAEAERMIARPLEQRATESETSA